MGPAAQVVIGVDAHKRTHTFVAADELGRELASKTLAATTEGTWQRSPGRLDGRVGAGRSRTADT